MNTDYFRKYCQLVLSSQYFTFTSLHSTHGSKEVLPYAPLLAASFKRKNHIVFAKVLPFAQCIEVKTFLLDVKSNFVLYMGFQISI